MKENSYYINLIHKKMTGALSGKERLSLNGWLSESTANQQIADEIAAIWQASEGYMTAQEEPDMAVGLARLRPKIKEEKTAIPVVSPPLTPPKAKTRVLYRIAAVAALLAGLLFTWNFLNQADPNLEIVQTNVEEQTDVMLEDETLVYLNESSRLEKALAFEADSRKVTFEGEAFFEVAKDATRPFSIATTNFDIEVLGTAFNVYAPDHAPLQEVVVDHGKVKVTIKQTGESHILQKGDRLLFDNKKKVVSVSTDIPQNAQSWRTGRLEFSNAKMEDVFFTLEKHFDIKIYCSNDDVKACTLTAPAFENANIEVVMETLKTIFNIKVKQKGKSKYYLSGGNSCTE